MAKLRLNLQKSYDKVMFFTLLQFLLVLMAFVAEAFTTRSWLNFSFIFQFILLFFAFNFYLSALKNLYYSFWNISLIFAIYYLVSMGRNFLVLSNPIIGLLFLFSFGSLAIACYIISSPLYYPRFHWWEYDFRFRADIRCWVEVEGKQYRGRISDLRRGAACLELFNSMPVGQAIQINSQILNQNFTLFAEVRSRREPIIGRSIIYGIKFVNNDLEQKQRLKFLTNYWNESKKIKIRNKFSTNIKS
jgi:hypothetical protein